MKLPPHILPTLNELSAQPKFADTVGFYVPHRGMEDGAGIYLPLPRAPNKSGAFKVDTRRAFVVLISIGFESLVRRTKPCAQHCTNLCSMEIR